MNDYDFNGDIIDRSGIGAVKWEIRSEEMKRRGIMPFSVADMELRTAPPIIEALRKAASLGIYGYTMPDGEYLSAVTGWFKRRHNYDFGGESVVPASGVVSALYALIREFVKPGQGVIIQPPVYMPFYSAIENGGGTVAPNPLIYEDGKYRMDIPGLEELARKPENAAMILCSPHNPVGRVWDAGELRDVADICRKNGVLLISDEIHCDLTRKKHTVVTTLDAGYKENAIVCVSPAKTFNMAGFASASVVIENGALRERFVKRVGREALGGVSYFGRTAAIAAYTLCDGWVTAVNAHIEDNFKMVKEFAEAHPELRLTDKEGTYLAWLDMRSLGLTDKDLGKFMEEKAYMAVNNGIWFGAEGTGFVRVNIAVPGPVLAEALERLDSALKSIR